MTRCLVLNALVALVLTLVAAPAVAGTPENLRVCAESGDPILAEAACSRVVATADARKAERALAYLYRGDLLRERGDLAGSLADYDRSIGLDLDNAGAHHNRGYVLGELGRYPEAIHAYTRALALDPDAENTHASRGATYINLEEFEKAAADYTQAIAHEPNEITNYANRARAYRGFGEDDRALADLATVSRLDPQNAEALLEIASIHHSWFRWQDAVDAAAEALKRDPASARAYNIRGDALAQMQDHDRAISDLTEALRLRPDMQVAYINRAGAYEGKKEDKLALAGLPSRRHSVS